MKVSVAKDSKKDAPVEKTQTEQSQSQQDQGQPQQQQEGQSSEQQAAEEETSDEEDSSSSIDVPSGTTAEILKWVGEDKQRAQAALDKEKQADRPRAGLTGELEQILRS